MIYFFVLFCIFEVSTTNLLYFKQRKQLQSFSEPYNPGTWQAVSTSHTGAFWEPMDFLAGQGAPWKTNGGTKGSSAQAAEDIISGDTAGWKCSWKDCWEMPCSSSTLRETPGHSQFRNKKAERCVWGQENQNPPSGVYNVLLTSINLFGFWGRKKEAEQSLGRTGRNQSFRSPCAFFVLGLVGRTGWKQSSIKTRLL